MSEHSVPLGQEFGGGDSDEADPVVANLQQSVNLANENCDRAEALAQTLSAQLREAKDRADRAEQWVMLIRREIEDHLMPAMRDGPKPTNSAARPRLLTLPTPSRSRFRRLWLRVTSTAALGCRDLF